MQGRHRLEADADTHPAAPGIVNPNRGAARTQRQAVRLRRCLPLAPNPGEERIDDVAGATFGATLFVNLYGNGTAGSGTTAAPVALGARAALSDERCPSRPGAPLVGSPAGRRPERVREGAEPSARHLQHRRRGPHVQREPAAGDGADRERQLEAAPDMAQPLPVITRITTLVRYVPVGY